MARTRLDSAKSQHLDLDILADPSHFPALYPFIGKEMIYPASGWYPPESVGLCAYRGWSRPPPGCYTGLDGELEGTVCMALRAKPGERRCILLTSPATWNCQYSMRSTRFAYTHDITLSRARHQTTEQEAPSIHLYWSIVQILYTAAPPSTDEVDVLALLAEVTERVS